MSTEWKMYLSLTLGLLGALAGGLIGGLIGLVWNIAAIHYSWKMLKENP